MKKVIISLVIIISTSLAGVYYYVHTPRFTVFMIQRAIDNHDWASFTDYVDIDGIYESVMNDAPLDDNAIAKGLSMVMASNLKELFNTKLKQAIESTDIVKSNSFLNIIEKAGLQDAPIDVKHSGKITEYTITSKTGFLRIPAKTTIIFRDEGLTYRLSGFNDSDMKKAQEIGQKLIADHYNLPIEDELQTAVTLKSVKKYKGCSKYIGKSCYSYLIMNETKVTNNTDNKIKKVTFSIYPSKELNTTKYRHFGSAENIKPKKSIVIGKDRGQKFNDYKPADMIFLEAPKEQLYYKVEKIIYGDDREVRVNDIEYINHIDDLPTMEEVLQRRQKYNLNDNYGVEEFLN